jgi:hypothetical protein
VQQTTTAPVESRHWLPRVHFFEIMDQEWCPEALRRWMTDYLAYTWRVLKLYRPAQEILLREFGKPGGKLELVDLGSGSGGPVRTLAADLLRRGIETKVTLTDLNPPANAALLDLGPGVAYWPKAVDATAVPATLKGVRTIFAAFHHFKPAQAVAIVEAAADAGENLAVFEITYRSARSIVGTLMNTTVALLLLTPLLRPFSWRRLFFTYLLPAVPLGFTFDGFISNLRTYTVGELESMLQPIADRPDYEIKVGQVQTPIVAVTYVVGKPRRRQPT